MRTTMIVIILMLASARLGFADLPPTDSQNPLITSPSQQEMDGLSSSPTPVPDYYSTKGQDPNGNSRIFKSVPRKLAHERSKIEER